jgi:hypothetical protein
MQDPPFYCPWCEKTQQQNEPRKFLKPKVRHFSRSFPCGLKCGAGSSSRFRAEGSESGAMKGASGGKEVERTFLETAIVVGTNFHLTASR